MKALLLSGYGAIADNIAIGEIPAPTLTPTDVLIDVHAASINPVDFKIVQGKLKLVQKLGFPAVLGFDVGGVVRAVGARVRQFKIGDAVYARSDRKRLGAFAEQVALDESWISHKPTATSFIEAAAQPLVGLTTVQGLRDRAHAQSGQRILIHAGSGGVGTFAIQYAKALGLHVTATTSSRNAELVKSLGADAVICYDKENYLQCPGQYDIVYDTLGGKYTIEAFGIVKRGGAVVSLAGVPSEELVDQIDGGWLMRCVIRLISSRVRKLAARAGAKYCFFLTEPNGAQLTEIASMIDAGKIKPVIDKIFPFDDIVAAMLYMAQGRARGKVVVQMK